jgi:preprotein translocase subunit Sss1
MMFDPPTISSRLGRDLPHAPRVVETARRPGREELAACDMEVASFMGPLIVALLLFTVGLIGWLT